ERTALRVQEELGSVAAVEVRPAAREVAAQRLGCGPPDRDDPLLAPLADAADEALVQVDAGALEPDGLADSQTGAVQELDEGGVAEGAGRCAGGPFDQPLCFARRQRPR